MKVRIGKGKLLVYPTSIPGIFLLRLPRLKSAAPPSLAIEINPVGESGSPTKKRGVVIRLVRS
jgi:hypothetical protein